MNNLLPEDLFFQYCFEGSLENLTYLKENTSGIDYINYFILQVYILLL